LFLDADLGLDAERFALLKAPKPIGPEFNFEADQDFTAVTLNSYLIDNEPGDRIFLYELNPDNVVEPRPVVSDCICSICLLVVDDPM
jgi:hypothetical protein